MRKRRISTCWGDGAWRYRDGCLEGETSRALQQMKESTPRRSVLPLLSTSIKPEPEIPANSTKTDEEA